MEFPPTFVVLKKKKLKPDTGQKKESKSKIMSFVNTVQVLNNNNVKITKKNGKSYINVFAEDGESLKSSICYLTKTSRSLWWRLSGPFPFPNRVLFFRESAQGFFFTDI